MSRGVAVRGRRAVLLVMAGLSPVAAAVASPDTVVIVARYQAGSLRVTDSRGLAAPRHHAGHYVEWTNEHEFLAARRLAGGATYKITARVVRVEDGQFPEGWGERSGKRYVTYHLRAVSARRSYDK